MTLTISHDSIDKKHDTLASKRSNPSRPKHDQLSLNLIPSPFDCFTIHSPAVIGSSSSPSFSGGTPSPSNRPRIHWLSGLTKYTIENRGQTPCSPGAGTTLCLQERASSQQNVSEITTGSQSGFNFRTGRPTTESHSWKSSPRPQNEIGWAVSFHPRTSQNKAHHS